MAEAQSQQVFLTRRGDTEIYLQYNLSDVWSMDVDAFVLPVGVKGGLVGGMAKSFLSRLGSPIEPKFREELTSLSEARTPPFVTPQTPLLVDISKYLPDIQIKWMLAATAYSYNQDPAQLKTSQTSSFSADDIEGPVTIDNAANAARAVILLASQQGFKKLALPLLGTGSGGLPSQDVAAAMFRAVQAVVSGSGLDEVHLLTRDAPAYNSLAQTVGMNPLPSANDLISANDKLNVESEVNALAESLLLKKTSPPLAVGVLGGWGAGKSFVMNLMRRRMMDIRAMRMPKNRDDFPYVGHVYLINFDAWTYAKSNLWASLMQTIFYELNRQITREKEVQDKFPDDPKKTLSIYSGVVEAGKDDELWKYLSDKATTEHQKLKQMNDKLKNARGVLKDVEDAITSNTNKEIDAELQLATWAPFKQVVLAPIARLFGIKYEASIDTAKNIRSWGEFLVFSMFELAAFVAPRLITEFQQYRFFGTLIAIGAVLVQTARAFDDWNKQVDENHRKIEAGRAQRIQEKLADDSNKQQLEKIQESITKAEGEVEKQRRLVGFPAYFSSLHELCDERLKEAEYEGKLGLMQKVKSDLLLMSNLLKPDDEVQETQSARKHREDRFPRGEPRIILFVDDLDRCPPDQVVEMLEAAQLLLKTSLFVVVLAMDVRYITRALEKKYERILIRGGDPSGLDYIEKIIQIPYQVRPIENNAFDNYIRSLTSLPPERATSQDDAAGGDTGGGLTGQDNPQPAQTANRYEALTTGAIAFNQQEHDFIVTCARQSALNPRSVKRLVNVMRLLKILWARPSQWLPPEWTVEQAIILLLALSCAYPDAMREKFIQIMKGRTPKAVTPANFSFQDLILQEPPELRGHALQEWQNLSLDMQNLFTGSTFSAQVGQLGTLASSQLTPEILTLVRTFSFVSDIGFGV